MALTKVTHSMIKGASINVLDYGAVGDGVTNDTDAFAAAAAAINSAGGGTLVIPSGVYIVGKQTFAGATGLGYSYLAANIIKIQNCTKPVIIEGNGAVLKAAAGLKFGSFDPVTGAVYNPSSLPFVNYDYRANAYWGMIELINNSGGVEVRNLELNGNISAAILGGFWGDTGRQCAANGIYAYGNSNFLVENIFTHHHCLDGVIIGYNGLTPTSPEYPHTIINVRSTYNARQGLSWVGGTNLTAISCQFSETGRAVFTSAPSSGLDIEAESSVCRNGTFINCQMVNNVGPGMLAESGDGANCTFIRCTMIGRTNYSAWPNKPGLVFTDCSFLGAIVNAYGVADATFRQNAAKFNNCIFSNDSNYWGTLFVASVSTGLANLGGSSANVIFDNCLFYAKESAIGDLRNTIIKNSILTVASGTTYLASGAAFMIAFGTQIIDCSFVDAIPGGAIPATPYYLNTGGTAAFQGQNIFPSSGNLRIFSSSEPNQTDVAQTQSQAFGRLFLASEFYSPTKNKKQIAYESAAPTSGTFNTGDIMLNNSPSAGGFIGWVCVSGGSPGTWKTFGSISA